ncbi:MAG: inositol monophosphatase family protein [Thermodesulfovibrionales bacterium]
MQIKLLREIGRVLLNELPSMRFKTNMAIGVGAAGDKTYPIDKRAEDIIISKLNKSGESLTIVSEEIGIKDIKGGGKKVLIDPVDGSRNAIAGIPFYCSSIAVADGDTIKDIETAYVVNLINGDEFWAERGKGAFLNGKKIFTRIYDELYLIAYEAQNPSRDIPEITPLLRRSKKTRCLGATALDLAYLACGSISIFVTPSLSRSFDFAGGWLLVREAGGIFTDIKGNPIEDLEISLKKSSSILAAGNERLHKKALKFLNKSHG